MDYCVTRWWHTSRPLWPPGGAQHQAAMPGLSGLLIPSEVQAQGGEGEVVRAFAGSG